MLVPLVASETAAISPPSASSSGTRSSSLGVDHLGLLWGAHCGVSTIGVILFSKASKSKALPEPSLTSRSLKKAHS